MLIENTLRNMYVCGFVSLRISLTLSDGDPLQQHNVLCDLLCHSSLVRVRIIDVEVDNIVGG